MIKIFEWNSKVNFVDSNNCFVGYDLADDCCSRGGYFISDHIHEGEKDFEALDQQMQNKTIPDDKDYVFNKEFFKEITDQGEGGAVVFEMKGKTWNNKEEKYEEHPPLYLHLFNIHNGYYAKEFVCTFGPKKEGEI